MFSIEFCLMYKEFYIRNHSNRGNYLLKELFDEYFTEYRTILIFIQLFLRFVYSPFDAWCAFSTFFCDLKKVQEILFRMHASRFPLLIAFFNI